MLCTHHGNVSPFEGVSALQNEFHMVATMIGFMLNRLLATGISLPELWEAIDPLDGEVLSQSVL